MVVNIYPGPVEEGEKFSRKICGTIVQRYTLLAAVVDQERTLYTTELCEDHYKETDMKSTLIISAMAVCMAIGLTAYAQEPTPAQQVAPPQQQAAPQGEPDLDPEKFGYLIGVQFGKSVKSIKEAGVDISIESVNKGVTDAIEGNELEMSDEEMKQVENAFRTVFLKKQQEKHKAEMEKNEAAEKAFMDENAKKEGVVTLPSGLQYKVIKEGTGASPKATDKVKVNYEGTLLDGTVFDSSYERGEPMEFQANRVIPGWTEALQLMKEGAEWQLWIPAKLAYGPRPPTPKIGVNEMLIFKVELIEVLPAEEAPKAEPKAVEIKPEAAPKGEAQEGAEASS